MHINLDKKFKSMYKYMQNTKARNTLQLRVDELRSCDNNKPIYCKLTAHDLIYTDMDNLSILDSVDNNDVLFNVIVTKDNEFYGTFRIISDAKLKRIANKVARQVEG